MPKKRKKSDYDNSHLEHAFASFWSTSFFKPTPVAQYQFHPQRLWRFDFAWPDKKLALEIQGQGPGHTSFVSRTNDADKANAALLLGWRLVYFTGAHLTTARIHDSCNLLRQLLGTYHADHQISPRTYVSAADRARRFRSS